LNASFPTRVATTSIQTASPIVMDKSGEKRTAADASE